MNPHSNARPVSVFFSLKIVLLNFIKISVEFQLIEISAFIARRPYNSMQNQYRVNYHKRGNHWKNDKRVLLLPLRKGKEQNG